MISYVQSNRLKKVQLIQNWALYEKDKNSFPKGINKAYQTDITSEASKFYVNRNIMTS